MCITLQSITKVVATSVAAVAMLALSVAASASSSEEEARARGMVVTVEAEVVAIDPDTREISLKGPNGQIVTVTATEQVVKLEDIKVGDRLVATYVAALEGELRAPTEEELAEPWVELTDSGISEDEDHPAVGGARVIRAVTTVEGMNRALETVTLKDSRGKLHLIGDVEPAKMEGVRLGDTVVVIFREALALSLEKKTAASAD